MENLQGDAKEIGFKLTSVDDNPISGEGEFISTASETAELILENHGATCETYTLASAFISDRAPLIAEMAKAETDLDDLYSLDWSASDTLANKASVLQDRIGELEDEIEELESEFEDNLGQAYGSMWSKELEYASSEEVISETFDANEYRFTSEGEFIR